MTASEALAAFIPPGQDKKIRARGAGRVITVYNHERVKVARSFFAWLFGVKKVGPKGNKQRIANSVEFPIMCIEQIKWVKPWFLFGGCFTIVVPGYGDRWRRSGKEKPHRLRFGRGNAEARMLLAAHVINLAAQRWGGPPLGELPPLKLVKQSWWETLLTAVRVAVAGA